MLVIAQRWYAFEPSGRCQFALLLQLTLSLQGLAALLWWSRALMVLGPLNLRDTPYREWNVFQVRRMRKLAAGRRERKDDGGVEALRPSGEKRSRGHFRGVAQWNGNRCDFALWSADSEKQRARRHDKNLNRIADLGRTAPKERPKQIEPWDTDYNYWLAVMDGLRGVSNNFQYTGSMNEKYGALSN